MNAKPLAYGAYQKLADSYAAIVETKPHNAFCERPAMVAMWPDLSSKWVLDAGCGPGIYSELLTARGARVTGIDISDRMIELAQARLGPHADLRLVDLSKPLDMFPGSLFDLVNAPLSLDYIADWRALFAEFRRILKPSGLLQFSCAHPAADADLFQTSRYYHVEQVEYLWKGFGTPVMVPSFRRPLEEIFMPLVENGFQILKVVEPRPTDEFKSADPRRFQKLMHRPCFLCIQARSAGA
jgi:SAM-dependent methyltransferase